jgi:hypothetical protein
MYGRALTSSTDERTQANFSRLRTCPHILRIEEKASLRGHHSLAPFEIVQPEANTAAEFSEGLRERKGELRNQSRSNVRTDRLPAVARSPRSSLALHSSGFRQALGEYKLADERHTERAG